MFESKILAFSFLALIFSLQGCSAKAQLKDEQIHLTNIETNQNKTGEVTLNFTATLPNDASYENIYIHQVSYDKE